MCAKEVDVTRCIYGFWMHGRTSDENSLVKLDIAGLVQGSPVRTSSAGAKPWTKEDIFTIGFWNFNRTYVIVELVHLISFHGQRVDILLNLFYTKTKRNCVGFMWTLKSDRGHFSTERRICIYAVDKSWWSSKMTFAFYPSPMTELTNMSGKIFIKIMHDY